ncbi:MAG TPA: hypothetical protein PKA63_03935 [Oligoflexia bacterium]|nr:hypothetical protein [Oligoflexia bacterium]HMP47802.1 hypothetical protein [Oligoflexia bacterium]
MFYFGTYLALRFLQKSAKYTRYILFLSLTVFLLLGTYFGFEKDLLQKIVVAVVLAEFVSRCFLDLVLHKKLRIAIVTRDFKNIFRDTAYQALVILSALSLSLLAIEILYPFTDTIWIGGVIFTSLLCGLTILSEIISRFCSRTGDKCLIIYLEDRLSRIAKLNSLAKKHEHTDIAYQLHLVCVIFALLLSERIVLLPDRILEQKYPNCSQMLKTYSRRILSFKRIVASHKPDQSYLNVKNASDESGNIAKEILSELSLYNHA